MVRQSSHRVPSLRQRIALSRAGLSLQHAVKAVRRRRRHRHHRTIAGHCPLCERAATFALHLESPRESPICLGCGSAPRQRAVAKVLGELGLLLESLHAHESSPSLCTHLHFQRRCRRFLPSYWFPGGKPGSRVGGYWCIDLQDQPLATASLDLVVTQDVLEHVADPMRALREVERTLVPGGVHVFTVPRMAHAVTTVRAELRDGELHHLSAPQFHRNPISREGALVVTDWGTDLEQRLADAGLACATHRVQDPDLGIPEAVEVFVASGRDRGNQGVAEPRRAAATRQRLG